MMTDKYILKGKQAVPCDDLMAWAEYMEESAGKRHVGDDHAGAVRVSTVFLGLNHQFAPNGPPLLFETLVFGGPLSDETERYSTWEEAEAGHAAMLARVRAAQEP